MKPIDLWELKKQIKAGEIIAFVRRGKVYLEDVKSGEAVIICDFCREGGQE